MPTKIISWNVNGLRSILSKGLVDYLNSAQADVVCLQEIKARAEQVEEAFPGYHVYWNSAERPGYSGTLTLTRERPIATSVGIGAPDHDREGRVLTVEFEKWYIVNVYTPNSQRELTRLAYRTREWTPAFLSFLRGLQNHKPVIVCGDMNVAHQAVDLARPKDNAFNAGFTAEERGAFANFLDLGLVDSFRKLNPDGGHYTWWSYQSHARIRNIGWRIDYVCICKSLVGELNEAFIEPHVMGSDHCPVGVVLGDGK